MENATKESFPKLRMVQIMLPEWQKFSAHCYERAPVLLHPMIYKAVKLTFLTDISSIATGVEIMSELDSGSLAVESSLSLWGMIIFPVNI